MEAAPAATGAGGAPAWLLRLFLVLAAVMLGYELGQLEGAPSALAAAVAAAGAGHGSHAHQSAAAVVVANGTVPDTPSRTASSRDDYIRRLYTPAAWAPFAAEDLPAEGLAPLTARVQRWIYEQQHPANCEDAKFYV